MIDLEVIHRIQETIEARKGAAPDSSYVSSLYAKGTDAICKKVIEEAAETIMAAKDGDRLHLVRETCDLWFHSMVLLSHFGIGVDDCDTIPALVGKAMPGRRPYNFAYQGWGPQHALELADREIKDHIREKTGAAVYLFIYGHVYRAAGGLQCAGGWGRDYPCYELEAGEPRYRGSFTEAHPWRALLYRGLLATNTVAVFKPAWPLPSRSAAGVELTAALLAKTRDRVLEQFPGSRFVVVMYPVNYTLAYEEQCRRAFTGKGLDTLAFPEPLLETVPPYRRFAEGDFGHPSAESNRVFAAWLARELSPMPEAAR